MSANSSKRPVDPAQIFSVSIYPPIGIARVGNSVDDNGWFYGPEVPGRFDEPPGGFKDAHGAVKRQVYMSLTTSVCCLLMTHSCAGCSIPSIRVRCTMQSPL